MIAEKTILFIQFLAACFMAFDYFFDEKQRKAANDKVESLTQEIKNRINKDIKQYFDYVVREKPAIVGAIKIIVISLVILYPLKFFSINIHSWVLALVVVILLTLICVSVPRLVGVLIAAFTPLVIGGGLFVIVWFVNRCPKGSVFGIGFILLLTSFGCRYFNLRL